MKGRQLSLPSAFILPPSSFKLARPGGSATAGALLARARDVRTARAAAILAGLCLASGRVPEMQSAAPHLPDCRREGRARKARPPRRRAIHKPPPGATGRAAGKPLCPSRLAPRARACRVRSPTRSRIALLFRSVTRLCNAPPSSTLRRNCARRFQELPRHPSTNARGRQRL